MCTFDNKLRRKLEVPFIRRLLKLYDHNLRGKINNSDFYINNPYT